jgi:DNA-binding XRE family transcriptional regulator
VPPVLANLSDALAIALQRRRPKPGKGARGRRRRLLEEDLRALREAAGVTQEELAERVAVDQSQISRLERHGDARVSLLKRYVEALGGELQIVATLRGKVVRLPVLTAWLGDARV